MDGAGEGASNKFLIEGRGKSLGQLTEPKRVQLRATANHSHWSMPVSTSSPLLGLARNVEISITYPLYIIGESSLQRILHKVGPEQVALPVIEYSTVFLELDCGKSVSMACGPGCGKFSGYIFTLTPEPLYEIEITRKY